ncbi:MAG: hypothetical protein KKB62_00730 [Nanoarchaeota archaeon]|nr:hypothetical protein [Nanoarchaeota archaeon]
MKTSIEVKSGNELYVNMLVRKLFSTPMGYGGNGKGCVIYYYPGFEIQSEGGKMRLNFLDSVNDLLKKTLKYCTITKENSLHVHSKIEKKVKELNPILVRSY